MNLELINVFILSSNITRCNLHEVTKTGSLTDRSFKLQTYVRMRSGS
jgi:hypothetical protein